MNNVSLIGRLTKDVEIKNTTKGDSVGSFTLAVNRNFTNQSGEREADFINCVIWKKQAEALAKYTQKGSQVGIEGRIQTRNYENQQGTRVYVTEIIVSQVTFIGSNNDTQGGQNNQSTNQSNQPQNSQNSQNSFKYDHSQDGRSANISEDDLPF